MSSGTDFLLGLANEETAPEDDYRASREDDILLQLQDEVEAERRAVPEPEKETPKPAAPRPEPPPLGGSTPLGTEGLSALVEGAQAQAAEGEQAEAREAGEARLEDRGIIAPAPEKGLARIAFDVVTDLPNAVGEGVFFETPRRVLQLADEIAEAGSEIFLGFNVAADLPGTDELILPPRESTVVDTKVGSFVRDLTPFVLSFRPSLLLMRGLAGGAATTTRGLIAEDAAAIFLADFLAKPTQTDELFQVLEKHPEVREPAMALLEAPEGTPESGLDQLQDRLEFAGKSAALGPPIRALGAGIRLTRAKIQARRAMRATRNQAVEEALEGVDEADVALGTADSALPPMPSDEQLREAAARVATRKVVSQRVPKDQQRAAADEAIQAAEQRIQEILPAEVVADPAQLRAAAEEAVERFGVPRFQYNFDRWTDEGALNEVFDSTTKLFQESIERARGGVVSDDMLRELANRAGLTAEQLLARNPREGINAARILASQDILKASEHKLREVSDQLLANQNPQGMFRFLKAFSVYEAVLEKVGAQASEAGRTLRALRLTGQSSLERSREIRGILERQGALAPRLSGQAGARGESLAELPLVQMAKDVRRLFNTGGSLATYARGAQRARARDVFRELYTNGLLWDIPTQVGNLSSSFVVTSLRAAEREVAAQLGRAAGRRGALRTSVEEVLPEERAVVGEGAQMMFGMMEGAREVFRMAAKGFRAETGFSRKMVGAAQGVEDARAGLGIAATGKLELSRRAIRSEALGLQPETAMGQAIDAIGRVVRIPGSVLGVGDDMGKVIAYRAESKALALRQATEEFAQQGVFRPTRQQVGDRMAEILAEPSQTIRIRGQDASTYTTFTDQRAKRFIQWAQTVQDVPFLGPVILTFARTPINIAAFNLERTPFAPLMPRYRQALAKGGVDADVARAQLALGSLAMASFVGLAEQGLITGTMRNLDPGDRERLRDQGVTPNSILLGGVYADMQRFEPAGTLMSIAGEAAMLMDSHDLDEEEQNQLFEVLAGVMAATGTTMLDKLWLQSVSNVLDAVSRPSGQRLERFAFQTAQNIGPVPGFSSLLRRSTRLADPSIPDVDPGAFTWAQEKIVGMADDLPRKRTLWGDPLPTATAFGRYFDALSPAKVSAPEPTAIDRMLFLARTNDRKMRKRTTFKGVPMNLQHWPRVYETLVQLQGGGKDIDSALRPFAKRIGTGDQTAFEFLDQTAASPRLLEERAGIPGFEAEAREFGYEAAVARNRFLIDRFVGRVRESARERAWLTVLDPEFQPEDERFEAFRQHYRDEALGENLRRFNPQAVEPSRIADPIGGQP